MLDAVNYRSIEKLRDGRNYVIRAQRRDDNIIDALHQQSRRTLEGHDGEALNSHPLLPVC
jgi:hypothetical protein